MQRQYPPDFFERHFSAAACLPVLQARLSFGFHAQCFEAGVFQRKTHKPEHIFRPGAGAPQQRVKNIEADDVIGQQLFDQLLRRFRIKSSRFRGKRQDLFPGRFRWSG